VPLATLGSGSGNAYGLSYDDLVQARVQAENANGWGSLSQVNLVGAKVQTTPTKMLVPTMGTATTTAQVQVLFTALATAAETGGASLDSYHLEWDQGPSLTTWVSLLGQTSAF
jgi:hypothetical protein